MKLTCSILVNLFFSLKCHATDLLIAGKDTFYLKTYPLEALDLKIRPFGIEKNTALFFKEYPGYQAIWRIIDKKLFLERILSFYRDAEKEQNIEELFKKNSLSYVATDKGVFADWLSISYYPLEPYLPSDKIVFLGGRHDISNKAEEALVRFEKGRVTINKLPQDYR